MYPTNYTIVLSCYKKLYANKFVFVQVIKSNWPAGHFLLRNVNNCMEKPIDAICLQYDDNKIVAGIQDWTIKIWDKNTLECEKVITTESIKKRVNLINVFFFRF